METVNNKDTMVGYTYFYRVTIEKQNKLRCEQLHVETTLQYIVLKFKSIMELKQIDNLLLQTGVVQQEDLNTCLLKYDAITYDQYLNERSIGLYVITSKTQVYATMQDVDVCDCLYKIVDLIPLISHNERNYGGHTVAHASALSKVKLSIARLSDQTIVTINV